MTHLPQPYVNYSWPMVLDKTKLRNLLQGPTWIILQSCGSNASMVSLKIGLFYKYYNQSLCLIIAILNVRSESNEKLPSVHAFSSNSHMDTDMLIFLKTP